MSIGSGATADDHRKTADAYETVAQAAADRGDSEAYRRATEAAQRHHDRAALFDICELLAQQEAQDHD